MRAIFIRRTQRGTGDHGDIASEAGTKVLRPQAKSNHSLAAFSAEAERTPPRTPPPHPRTLQKDCSPASTLASAFRLHNCRNMLKPLRRGSFGGSPRKFKSLIISIKNKAKDPQTYPHSEELQWLCSCTALDPMAPRGNFWGCTQTPPRHLTRVSLG